MSRRMPLFSQHLEKVSRDFLETYLEVFEELIRGRNGVYALYRGEKLYYIGLATNLRTRLRQHLKDSHSGAWDTFSVYLTRDVGHIKELESLLLCIAKPPGNKQGGRFKKSHSMKAELARAIKNFFKVQQDQLLGRKRKNPEREIKKFEGKVPTFAGVFDRATRIRAFYKGKTYKARVLRDGRVSVKSQKFVLARDAVRFICKKGYNPWRFWSYERAPDYWERLDSHPRRT